MHYYKFNIADYRKDTAHLSRLEHSIYRDLIDWYYLDEAPIPEETQTVSRRLRLVTQEEATALNSVLNDFFYFKNGWHHKRIDMEIAEYNELCKKNKDNGKAGGRPKKTQTVSSGNPDETDSKPNRNPNHKPVNHKPVNITTHDPEGFVRFWESYPRKEAKAAALKSWQSKKPKIEDVLLALQTEKQRWTDPKYIPHPSTWLNQRRWEDILVNVQAEASKDKVIAMLNAKGIQNVVRLPNGTYQSGSRFFGATGMEFSF